MKEMDGRKLDHKTLEQIRIRAVKRVEAGESPEVVVKALGFHRSCIYEWIAKYREGGEEALKARPLSGRPAKLTGKQLRWIYKTVVGKNPLQLKFPFALWTRAMVKELVQREFGVNLSVVSVGRMLKKLGFTPQKPLHRATQQNSGLVIDWMAKELPKIKAKAKRAGATLYFADESSVRSDYHSGTTWGLKGKTPVVSKSGSRFKVNMISAISTRGDLRFMAFEGSMNSERFIRFLRRLIHNASKPVFLVLDNHSVHRSNKVKTFVESTRGKLKLFFLPPYSPELNPDELVWNNMKRTISKQVVTSKKDLKKRVISFLRSLQKSPGRVRRFFEHPVIKWPMSMSVYF